MSKFIGKVVKPTTEIKLTDFNLNSDLLVNELNDLLNKPNPKLLISKWWQEKHFPHDHQRIDHITAYVEKINLANQSILSLQAKLAVNKQVLEMMIAGQLAEAERMAELQLAQHKNEVQKLADEMEDRKLQLESKKIANRISEADARLKEEKIELIAWIRKNISIDDLLPHHKTMLMQAMIVPDGYNFIDLEILQEMKKYVLEQAGAETEKKRAEAERMKDENEFKKWQNERKRNKEV